MTLIDRVTEGSQTVATKENCPPNPFLNPNPNRGGRGGGRGSFPRGAIVRTPLQNI